MKSRRNLIFFIAGACFFVSSWVVASGVPSSSRRLKRGAFRRTDDSTLKDSTQKYKTSTRPTYKPSDRFGDPFANPDNRSPLQLTDPNVQTKVELDSATGKYIIYEKIGETNYRPTSSMTRREYERYLLRNGNRDYMQAKSAGLDANDAVGSKGLIPKIYINPMFDRIFGGNFVDIRPNGSVMLDFGGQWQRIQNPAFPIRQQRNGTFLFDQQISLNVVGKIGEKLKMTVNQDTKASFEFENNIRLEYTGFDNEIIQKIEAGNVSLPMTSSLITGAQNLFGIKTQLQFGRLKITSVASSQRGKSEKISIKGGAQSRDISIRVDAYEANRHFFLSQFFRNRYDGSLKSLPVITSGVTVTRVEAYVTNRANNTQTLRNIVGFTDLGEGYPFRRKWQTAGQDSTKPAGNNANALFNTIGANPAVRETPSEMLLSPLFGMEQGTDFDVIRGARRLTDRDFKFHAQLGYITLNTPLQADEVLAVSFEYTINGVIYKVGEMTEDYSVLDESRHIYLKLLRPARLQTNLPTWNLMMKNIYSLGASQIGKENFQLRVIYRDDSSGVDNPSLPQGSLVRDKPLVQVFGVDRLNPVNELQPDGNYDFIEDVTIDSKNGRVMFPVIEPFGSFLETQFVKPTTTSEGESRLINRYVFNELYQLTQADALQAANKAKFFLVGKTQSSSSSEIMLPGINVAPGSVTVVAGITPLVENQHYSVDYDLGRVRILDQGIINSGQTVEIRYEKSDLFGFQQRSLFGSRWDYTISKDLNFGGTVLYLNERPLIRRVSVGDEPTRNMMLGFDVNYRTDSRFLTKMVDKLPLIQTKETSNINLSAEYARLIPMSSKFVDKTGKGLSFIDDFEGSRTSYDLGRQPIMNWKYSSVPVAYMANPTANGLEINDNRARLAWYSIDNIFYRQTGSIRPKNISAKDLENNYIRAVGPFEVFPNRSAQAVNLNEPTFDLAFYPSERGQYNFNSKLNPDGTLPEPEKSWGGITRRVNSDTDFDNANIEYVEFWLMDPFIEGVNGNVDGNTTAVGRQGTLTIDLGTISEDALRDGRQSFENGLPTNQQRAAVDKTPWAVVPQQQWLTAAFDNTAGARSSQDVGLDGMSNQEEATNFQKFLGDIIVTPDVYSKIAADPSNDDFKYHLDPSFEDEDAKVLQRYKFFNGSHGNSPENTGGLFTPSSTNIPDNEDVNDDRTVNDENAYYSYKVNINPNDMRVGSNYIVDQIQPSGKEHNWYLVRIPVKDLTHPNFAGKTGNINDFKSIRYMRMHMTGFSKPTVLRFVQFQLVASQWRKYPGTLATDGGGVVDEDESSFVVSAVNIEENGSDASGTKVPYPKCFFRDRDVSSNINRQLNEQSLSLCVDRLPDGASKAVFKNVKIDFLNYKRLEMDVHAQTSDVFTKDNEVSAFIRIGTDFTDNYYEIEVPLQLTKVGVLANDPDVCEKVFPTANKINILFGDLYRAKLERNAAKGNYLATSDPVIVGRQIITVRGNPDLNSATTVMIGIRNPGARSGGDPNDDQRAKSICMWVNELRVSEFDKNQGWATTGRLSIKLADLATVTASGRYSTIGFGSIEQRISERSRSNIGAFSTAANVTLDRFLPKKSGLKIPMYVSYDLQTNDPKFDPLNPDILVESSVEAYGGAQGRAYKRLVQDRTQRKSINFTNIQKTKTGDGKPQIYDIENWSFTYAYSETKRTNVNIADYTQWMRKYALGYNFSNNMPAWEPFKKWKRLKSPYLKLIKDFNFSFLPSNLAFRADLDRTFTRTSLRSAANVFDSVAAPQFEKAYTLNRNYALGWNITKSITFNYTADVKSIIDEPTGNIDNTPLRAGFDKTRRDSVRQNLRNFGRMKNFDQTLRANYRVPLDKLPLTNWLSADLTYTAGYSWAAAPLGLADTLGNRIQNNRDRSINGRIDLLKLYNKVKILNKINTEQPKPRKPKADESKLTPKEKADLKKKKEAEAAADTIKKPREFRLLKGIARTIMSVKSINFTYSLTENTILPGYRPNVNYLGLTKTDDIDFAPGGGFVFLGDQNPAIRYRASDAGWLGTGSSQNQAFAQARTENFSARTTLEPFRDFRLQLETRRTSSASYQEIFRDTAGLNQPSSFASLNPSRTGTYSISFIAIRTAFNQSKNDNENRSEVFKTFEKNRAVIKERLDARDGITDASAYDTNSQHVLIPAFVAAYGGIAPQKANLSPFPDKKVAGIIPIPLPNWRVDYSGLTRIGFLADKFSAINVTHSYTSNYTVSNYTSSLQYGAEYLGALNKLEGAKQPDKYNQQGNLIPVYNIGMVSISEKFAPLIGFNLRTKGKTTFKIDYNRDRNLTLNVANAQITEISSRDITFGVGYQKTGMKLPFKSQGRTIVLKNEVTMRCDITIRETIGVQRKINEINTITQGFIDFQLKPTINYVVNQRLNIQAYFERQSNQPRISTSFKRTNTRFGIQLRFSLS